MSEEQQDLQDIVQAQEKILKALEQLNSSDPDRPPTSGEKTADWIVKRIGSWPFLVGQSIFLILWAILNTSNFFAHWDSYPYIFMNLMLSLQAAVAGPLILMASNRSNQKDQRRSIDAYKSIVHIEKLLEELYQKIERKGKNGNGSAT